MTHLINQWQRPARVKVLQTSRSLINPLSNPTNGFDVHPNHADPDHMHALITAFELPHEPIFMQQVHGNQVIEYLEPPKAHFDVQADACFTRLPDVICAVMTADCLPVIMTDTEGSFVAAVHCGWRSLYANILSQTLEAINPQHEVLVWFGPCILQDQYEVDESFVVNYLKRHPDANNAFTEIIDHNSLASLYTMAEIQLQNLGIKQIQQSMECTYLNKQYYSWRENSTPHRMGTMAWIKPCQP
ncbi:peptidoglycan editing factor PgeF [Marinicella litoralis]|uniref:Purine nucleoside phosphorylase n=1 Tax=Marinicella litoralis TaxID=644220 RepID=A0A4R6XRH7_9GAMM|nr:peptidoglycan editing factor PgeF [Marinicella litoralis]TDR20850.1 hypothetical protein C8D91_1828 [Marinicella litoralis]